MLFQGHPTCGSRTIKHVGPTPANRAYQSPLSMLVQFRSLYSSTPVPPCWSKTSPSYPLVQHHLGVQHRPTFFNQYFFHHAWSCWFNTKQHASPRPPNMFFKHLAVSWSTTINLLVQHHATSRYPARWSNTTQRVGPTPSNMLVQRHPICFSDTIQQLIQLPGWSWVPRGRSLILFSFSPDPLAWYKIYHW